MALKRTYFHREHAIVHRTFATEQTEEVLHQFIVNKVGDSRTLFSKSTLEAAQQAINELLDAQPNRTGWRSSATNSMA